MLCHDTGFVIHSRRRSPSNDIYDHGKMVRCVRCWRPFATPVALRLRKATRQLA